MAPYVITLDKKGAAAGLTLEERKNTACYSRYQAGCETNHPAWFVTDRYLEALQGAWIMNGEASELCESRWLLGGEGCFVIPADIRNAPDLVNNDETNPDGQMYEGGTVV